MSLFLADTTKAELFFSEAPCKSLVQRGNYFPGPSVINLNSLLSQIVAHNKYGAARDAYLL